MRGITICNKGSIPCDSSCCDFPVDFKDAEFGGHGAAVADDHHQVDQYRSEFARHDRHQERPKQLRLARHAGPESELHHHGNPDENCQRPDKPEWLNANGQHLQRDGLRLRPRPIARLVGQPEHRPDHRGSVPQFIPLQASRVAHADDR